MYLHTDVTDPMLMRRSFGHYPSGIAAISAVVDGEPSVIVASSFMVGISLDPPLVSFAPQKSSASWPVLRRATRLGVSVLGSDQNGLCRQLSSKDRALRFAGVSTTTTDQGAVLLDGAASWFECSLYGEHDAGDHTIAVMQVHGVSHDEAREPLIFHGSSFREMALAVSA